MASENLKRILAEFDQWKGTFIMSTYDRPGRLIGIASDDLDYYYMIFDGKDIKYHSCVGRIIPLKGYLRKEDYNELVRLAKLNHYDQYTKEQFLEVYNQYILEHKVEIITPICWDLNKDE